ncbi:ParA family protein [Streptomyces sp. AN-3]|uniref:ParA family protein n=1 Tax=Streptomyces sp. AN-3 TaxID=3044177 RepID=UPI00249A28DA|nr:ParA family protein [Streptomyces sp. AN-3]MDI3102447.1 ParA family protein [Streptomyces sp. AN-3]
MTDVPVVGSYSETGGATKTTTGVSLAVCYAEEHPDELVVLGDLDPRGAATKWTEARPAEPGLDMSAILGNDDVSGWAEELAVPLDPKKGWPENLRVIPSGFRVQATQESMREDHAELRLKRSLKGTSAGLVVFDFPNRQGGVITQNGLTACNRIVYAAKPDEDGLDGVDGAKETVDKFREYRVEQGLPDSPREAGIVLGSAYRGAVVTRDERRAIEVLQEQYGELLLTPFVPWLGIVLSARSAGEWYGKYAKGRSVAVAYRELVNRIVTA